MQALITRLKQWFSRQPGEEALPTQRFLDVIEGDAPEAIEAARDWVQPADVVALSAYYWRLSDWSQKRAVVEILQDQYHADLPGMMLDFLRIPVAGDDERTELAQAIALGFVDEQYDRFMTYYNDRELLTQDVQTVLRQRGLQAEPPAQKQPAALGPARPTIDASGPPDQRLLDGATRGDLAAVQQALSEGANVNAAIAGGDYAGCSALIMALMRQRFAVAAYLIEQGADVNYKRPAQHTPERSRGQTALWWAANHGHLPLAQELISRGAEVNTPDHHGGTPLIKAAGSGHLEMVRYLAANGADLYAEISDGRNAFHLAVTDGRTSVAAYLLELGFDPNIPGGSGYTPLMVAAEHNYYELAQLLIQHGADVNAVHTGPGIYIGLRGWTPLVFAVNAGYVRMTKLLLQAGADREYRVPAGRNWQGNPMPERGLLDFAKGKRSESLAKLLQGQKG